MQTPYQHTVWREMRRTTTVGAPLKAGGLPDLMEIRLLMTERIKLRICG
jgi:hypothetical protein